MSAAAASSTKLFTPIRLGHVALKHRVAMAPMTRCRALNNEPNELLVKYYEQRATDGGLLITEGTAPSEEGRISLNVPGIYAKSQVENWKPVTAAVHSKGGFIFCQLWHVGRQSHSSYNPKGLAPAGASTIPMDGKVWTKDGEVKLEVPRQLTEAEIKDVINDFAQAAKNAIEAGFDGVEIHGANGYIIDQFLNSTVNAERTDKYGGSIENRIRFAYEVTQAVVDAIGADRVGIRFSPLGTYGQMGDATPVETWSAILEKLNPLNLAYVHIMAPSRGGGHPAVAFARKVYKGNLITASDHTPSSAVAAVENGEADVTAFGRPFITNPDLVERIRNGWELDTNYDFSTFYTSDAKGYTDYAIHGTK